MSKFPRVIPVLTVRDGLLVKPHKFGKETYVGDPINAVRIFNEKQVDEIIIIDLEASENPGTPNLRLLEEISGEAFMPVAYGGGVNSKELARAITGVGTEKVIVNSGYFTNPELISDIASEVGSQSVVGSLDCRGRLLGRYDTFAFRGTKRIAMSPVELAQKLIAEGAGELIVNSIDRESTFGGYDLGLIASVASTSDVPIVALGGARGIDDFRLGVSAGASAVAAGSAFVFQGKHRAVLITYPNRHDILRLSNTEY